MKSRAFSFLAAALLVSGIQAATDPKLPGNFFLSTDNGTTWTAVDLGFPKEEIITAWVSHHDRLIAGTSNHGIYAFDAMTRQWVSSGVGLPFNARIRSLSEVNGVLFAAVQEEGLYASVDGKNWQPAKNSPSRRIRKILAVNGIIYIGADEGIFVAESFDKPWKVVLSGVPTNDIIFHQKKLFAATGIGIFRSEEGKTWAPVYSGMTVARMRVSPNELTATTYDDKILVANPDGSAWALVFPFIEGQYICQIPETNSRIIIEQWMTGLSFLRVRKDVYSPESSEKIPFKTLIPLKGGVMLVNTADIGC